MTKQDKTRQDELKEEDNELTEQKSKNTCYYKDFQLPISIIQYDLCRNHRRQTPRARENTEDFKENERQDDFKRINLKNQEQEMKQQKSRAEHISESVIPNTTDEQCQLYKEQGNNIEKHCLDMKCNGYKLYFCYVKPKDNHYQI